jgi:hypothetical protein
MKHETMDKRDRVWTVTQGPDGRLQAELDPKLMARLAYARSAKEVVDALAEEVARTRDW